MLFLSLLVPALCLLDGVHARYVFAHYMVGTVTQAHAQKDIEDAQAMGLDGFALNVGDATQPFVEETLHYLFDYAETVIGFHLYISMDVYASGAACYAGSQSCHGPFDYASIFKWALASPAYYRGLNGLPMISTFSSGGFDNITWAAWRETLANQMYFIPDFDETAGYYEGESSYGPWYYYWGGVLDGLFSWESAWPVRSTPNPGTVGGAYPGDISLDQTVLAGAKQYGKGYMMGLSPLQYKNSYGTNIYRNGDDNLPQRMQAILNMSPQPDFIQIQTWNDGPESHYIGNIWPEQNTDSQPAAYMGPGWSHTAWQPLITSFINSWKGDLPGQANMIPPRNFPMAAGAMWYRTILKDITCPKDDGATGSTGAVQYYEKPDGYDAATDTLNWAIVMQQGTSEKGMTVRVVSNEVVLSSKPAFDGLNSGSVTSVQAGNQRVEVVDSSGKVVASAIGGVCITTTCADTIYNMNYQVAPLIFNNPANIICEYNPGGIFTVRAAQSPDNTTTGVALTNDTTLAGDLSGQELYDTIFSILNGTCDQFGCAPQALTIPNLDYVQPGQNGAPDTGTLTLTIADAHWLPGDKEALLGLAAQTFLASANATNCQVEQWSEGCGANRKRHGNGTDINARSNDLSTYEATTDVELSKRNEDITCPTCPVCVYHHIEVCNIVSAISIEMIQGTSIVGWMDITASFEGSTTPFDCQSFIDSINAFIDPFAEADQIVDILGKVSSVCGKVSAVASLPLGQ